MSAEHSPIRQAGKRTQFLTQSEAAEVLTVSQRSLERWRVTGEGPKFIRIGRRIIYDMDDLIDHARERKFRSTSEADAADEMLSTISQYQLIVMNSTLESARKIVMRCGGNWYGSSSPIPGAAHAGMDRTAANCDLTGWATIHFGENQHISKNNSHHSLLMTKHQAAI